MRYKNLIILFFFMLFIACIGNKDTQIVKYKPYGSKPILKIRIPKGYLDVKYFSGGNQYQQEYWYNDSIVLYMTNFENTRNYEEIRKQGTYHKRFEALHFNKDSLTLSGKNNKGRFWKDRLLEDGITIGYENVPKNKKQAFDNALKIAKHRH